MQHHTRNSFAAAVLLAGLPLSAGSAVGQEINCDDPQVQFELNVCAARDFQKADRKLNEVYQTIIAKNARQDGAASDEDKAWVAALRISQRAWVAFRDADCDGLVGRDWFGGSGQPMAVNACKAELTRRRTKDLVERYDSGR